MLLCLLPIPMIVLAMRAFARYVRPAFRERQVELGELNADGDVGGEEVQMSVVRSFYRKVIAEKPRWLSGITFYQFRDRGRLGLEAEDPNNPEVGSPTLLHPEYRRIIQDPYFLPRDTWKRTNPGARRRSKVLGRLASPSSRSRFRSWRFSFPFS